MLVRGRCERNTDRGSRCMFFSSGVFSLRCQPSDVDGDCDLWDSDRDCLDGLEGTGHSAAAEWNAWYTGRDIICYNAGTVDRRAADRMRLYQCADAFAHSVCFGWLWRRGHQDDGSRRPFAWMGRSSDGISDRTDSRRYLRALSAARKEKERQSIVCPWPIPQPRHSHSPAIGTFLLSRPSPNATRSALCHGVPR